VSAGARQLIGSLLVGIAIVAITIAIVTAKLGPGGGRDDDDDRGGDRTEQTDGGRGRGRAAVERTSRRSRRARGGRASPRR
jgi:hypothetical protein